MGDIITGSRLDDARIDLGKDPIISFSGPYRFLSNPWACEVPFEGDLYRSAEHAFQAAKSHDPGYRAYVNSLARWQEAKEAGCKVPLRQDWERVKRALMLQVVLAKFTHNPSLGDALVSTGWRYLVEGNWWGDTTWGAVTQGHRAWSADLPWWQNEQVLLAGYNWLGIALMYARDMLAPMT